MAHYYWKLVPRGAHKKFRIQRTDKAAKTASYVKDERLAAINELYARHTIDFQVASAQVDTLVKEFRENENPTSDIYLESNLDILAQYLKQHYDDRDILPESRQAAEYSFKRAVSLLAELDLATADPATIQKRIYNLAYPKRAHVVLSLNALFRFLNRTHKFLVGKNKSIERVKHLTLAEFQTVLPLIKNEHVRLIAATAFASGCRVGELFSLTHYNPKNRSLTIHSQIDRKKKERATKTYQMRTTVIVAELEEFVKKWLALSIEERLAIRNLRLSGFLKEACRAAFPDRMDKRCHFYDLRHSYAIHFLSLGVSVDLIAAALGNSPTVCREHYTGFILTDEGTTLINLIQNQKAG